MTARAGWDCHSYCLKGSEGSAEGELPSNPIQIHHRQQDYQREPEQPSLTHQHEKVRQVVQCRRKWIDSGSVIKKGVQSIGGFINASPHFNFWLEKRNRTEACRIEVLVSIKRLRFVLFLFSTQVWKLKF